jgi:hypothetical protein
MNASPNVENIWRADVGFHDEFHEDLNLGMGTRLCQGNPEDTAPARSSQEVAQQLLRKDFCVVQSLLSPEAVSKCFAERVDDFPVVIL